MKKLILLIKNVLLSGNYQGRHCAKSHNKPVVTATSFITLIILFIKLIPTKRIYPTAKSLSNKEATKVIAVRESHRLASTTTTERYREGIQKERPPGNLLSHLSRGLRVSAHAARFPSTHARGALRRGGPPAARAHAHDCTEVGGKSRASARCSVLYSPSRSSPSLSLACVHATRSFDALFERIPRLCIYR